jgi:hypothetical protein
LDDTPPRSQAIRSLYQFLYGSTPATFRSAFGLEESVERLRAATKRTVFSALAQAAAVGRVKQSNVRLQRVIPMFHNSFKPFFFGRFEARPDGVYLTGRFSLLPLVKIFMTFWLGTTIVFGIVFAASGQSRDGGAWGVLTCLGMSGFGIGLIAFGKWLARKDVDWLSTVIRTALQAPEPLGAASATTARSETGTPMVLKLTAGFLILAGVANLASVYANLMPKGPVASQFSEPFLRTSIAIMSLLMIALAIGIYQRKLLAWRLGLAFLAASAVLSLLQIFLSRSLPEPMGLRIFEFVAMLVVFALWSRWWYAQRIHFLEEDAAWPSNR